MFDSAARFSPDELSVYFTSLRGGRYEIYSATRSSLDADFKPAFKVANIGSTFADLNPSVTADGLTLFFDSGRTGAWALYTATREAPGDPWSAGKEFAPLLHGPEIAEGMPYVLPKGDVVYFQSNRSADKLLHVFRLARDAGGTWSSPQLVTGFSTNYEFSPAVSSDELALYFATDRDASTAEGDYDIWMATRQTKTAVFASPKLVAGVNTTLGETPSWISADACRLYFTRRIGDSYDARVYMATRTPPDAGAEN
jgi:Tol biopolymer transport system component